MTLQKIEFEYDIPDGYRFVRFGKRNKNDLFIGSNGVIKISDMNGDFDYWIIVEKIPEQEQSTSQPELKLQYKTQQGDWRDVNDVYEYRIKPKTKTVRFRNYLDKNGTAQVSLRDRFVQDDNMEKWLGDWQEVEIEEND